MDDRISEDLAEMKKKLSEYVDKGRVVGYTEVREGPVITVKPDKMKIKPLKKVSTCNIGFVAVDCSTRTLKRANNWGIYLLRSAYALVKGRDVDWAYEERMFTATGDAHLRRNQLATMRFEYESELALHFCREHKQFDEKQDYLLLDGASYFGTERRFSLNLYKESERKGIRLFTIAKQSPSLMDEKGRDFMSAVNMFTAEPIWVYHPVKKADFHESLYGDIAVVKLSPSTFRTFRCDIMEYLSNSEVHELISPITSLSEDPRCLGYPVALWLAHDFSAPSDAKLLHCCEQIERTWDEAGLLDVLHREELSCSFADEIHGIRYAFQREWWGDYV